MNKKAQAQIITTVLIILLVLAAIVIVWQVVNTTVRGGAEEIEQKATCLGINLNIKSVTDADVVVERSAGGTSDAIEVNVIVNGVIEGKTTTNLAPLEQATYTHNVDFGSGDEIQVAPVVDEVQCDIVDTEIAA